MGALRNFRRESDEFLIGQRLNRYGGNSRKANRAAIQAALVPLQARAFPESQSQTFRHKVQAALNADRGGISLAEAIAEGQL
jgi:hypothetical protein